ncbi:MAG: nucleotidyltransferase domain-containing protein [Candidatus Lokiarchaeia archaeon]|nr:nucleotidyltransferase domain-containing protein [Candidatus Lokiarchaeia archaeon]
MRIAKAIEGDYIETIEDNLFFDVKGLLHPNDYIISFLRFFPHPDGERKRKGINYKKLYKLNERYEFLKKNFPKYLFYSDELDLEIQGVKKDEIKKIYTPRNFFKYLIKKKSLSLIEKYSKDLCELFITEGDISENSIGITGSIMVGLNTEDSDIDLIIYGTETSIKFQENLSKIFKKSNNCRKYTFDEYKSHYNWRFGGSDILFKDFLKSEQRKQHQGKFMDRDYIIRYIKSPNDWKGSFYDYKYENFGRIKLKAEIIDSKNAIFTPCSYKISPLKILESNIKSGKLNMGDINEINSFRGRFCEHAKTGEIVLAEGKIEKVIFKNNIEHFRILLTDQIKDKLLVLN